MAVRETDDEPDEPPYRTPLPKDDRLWRHPSELADAVPTASPPTPDDQPRRASRWRFRRHPQH